MLGVTYLNFKVAIDGPAGSGKSSISKLLASELHMNHIDTGAMYRAVTLEALNRGIDLENDPYDFLSEMKIEYDHERIFLNDVDVTEAIRTVEVSNHVSIVARQKVVRDNMVKIQRKAANSGFIIMDGRDIGTVVLPDADLKIFITASIEERADRRYKELVETGADVNLEEIKAQIAERDHLDSTRKLNPLKQADDAVLVDTTNHTIEEVKQIMKDLIQERGKENGIRI